MGDLRTPGFASPPHDGFAIVGAARGSGTRTASKTRTSLRFVRGMRAVGEVAVGYKTKRERPKPPPSRYWVGAV